MDAIPVELMREIIIGKKYGEVLPAKCTTGDIFFEMRDTALYICTNYLENGQVWFKIDQPPYIPPQVADKVSPYRRLR